MTTYYMRADGTAANKAAATSDAAASTSLDVTGHNAETFSAGDVIVVSDAGGIYRLGTGSNPLIVPSSGSSGNPITYQAAGNLAGGGVPVMTCSDLITGWTVDSGDRWQATVTIDPINSVYLDGTRGIKAASQAAVDATNEWFWSASVLYVHSAGGDPDTVFTSPGIESCRRNQAIEIASKDWIDVAGIKMNHGRENLTTGTVWIHGTSSNINIKNCVLDLNDAFACVYITSSGTNINVTNCTMTNGHRGGVTELAGGIFIEPTSAGGSCDFSNNAINNNQNGAGIKLVDTPNCTITNNVIHTNGSAGITINNVSCINNIIEFNICHTNQQDTTDRFNIDLFQVGTGNIVRYNITHDCNFISIDAGGIRFDGSGSPFDFSDNLIYYNVCYNERQGIQLWNATDVEVYNNAIYNSGVDGIKLHFSHNSIVKNNIVHTAAGTLIFDDEADTPTINNNLYFPDGAAAFKLDVTTYNFADWKTNSGHDAGSINADPLFTNPGSQDFTLLSGSPAIDAGVDVSLIQDFVGRFVPQNNVPDMGAYEKLAQSGAQAMWFDFYG